MIEKNTSTELT